VEADDGIAQAYHMSRRVVERGGDAAFAQVRPPDRRWARPPGRRRSREQLVTATEARSPSRGK
jgi:hypothetical protein